jgi:ankyrin repeat protein
MKDSTAVNYQEAMTVLANGGNGDLERLGSQISGFPDGVDPWIGRYWIINAIDSGSLLSVKWMLDRKVNLIFTDGEGGTVLHSCIDRNRPDRMEILHALIEAGADLNARGLHDWTPLHLAAYRNNLEAVEILLKAGADPKLRTRIDNFATPDEEAGSPTILEMIKRFAK